MYFISVASEIVNTTKEASHQAKSMLKDSEVILLTHVNTNLVFPSSIYLHVGIY